jgi:hypothetical protein
MGEASNPGGAFVTDLSTAGITSPSSTISGAYATETIAGTTYDVAVLNLGENGDSSAQDQLISWTQPSGNNSAPDGGTTVSLLGMGLGCLALLGRRFGKS